MKIYVAAKETGDIITEVNSYDEGKKLIAEYEAADKADGTYADDFYAIVDEDRFEVICKTVYSVEWSRAGESDRYYYETLGEAEQRAEQEVNCRSQFDLDRCQVAVQSHQVTIRAVDDTDDYHALDSAILGEDIPCFEGCNALCDAIDYNVVHEGRYYAGI